MWIVFVLVAIAISLNILSNSKEEWDYLPWSKEYKYLVIYFEIGGIPNFLKGIYSDNYSWTHDWKKAYRFDINDRYLEVLKKLVRDYPSIRWAIDEVSYTKQANPIKYLFYKYMALNKRSKSFITN